MGLRRRDVVILAALALGFVLLSLPREPALVAPRLPALDDAATARATPAAPLFELPRAGGGRLGLADHLGSVVLVNFWATWCPPCRAELPALQALHGALADEGLVVLAVSVDAGAPEHVARFAAERGLDLPVLLDPEQRVARLYGVGAYPTSVVVDRAGRIAYAAVGALAWDTPESVAWFRALLRRPAPPPAGAPQ